MRSLLFVPGDQPAKLEKALTSGADALLIDLEDSVGPARKAEARACAAAFITAQRARTDRPRMIVRINPLHGEHADADLDSIAGLGPDAIMLPKAMGGPDVMLLSAKLAAHEAMANLPEGSIGILPIATETAAALFVMGSYRGASRRLIGLAWGAEDLAADLGAETNRADDGAYAPAYQIARTMTLLAAAAAEVAPVDTVFTAFRDMDGLRREAEAARREGFTAKMAIHPAQVPVINEVFTPSPEAIAKAKRIVAAFAGAGDVGVVAIDGQMIDKPHLRQAQRLLARAGKL